MKCQYEGTLECKRDGGCNVDFMELSKTDNVLAVILAFLLWVPIVAIWYLAIGIDKVIEFLHGKQR